jgi:hypothetical protein
MDTRNAARQQALGLPAEPLLARRLLFDPTSRSLILSFHVTRAGVVFPQVYVRGPADMAYAPVTSFFPREENLNGDQIAVETPVLSVGGRLYCLFNSRGQRSAAGHVPIFSVGIGFVDLTTGHSCLWPATTEFSAIELVGSAADGSRVCAVVGLLETTPQGKRMNYAVGEFNVSERTFQLVAALSAPFF